MRVINKVVVGDVENLKNYKVWRVLYTDARGLYNKVDDNLYTYKDAEEVCHIAIDSIGKENILGFLVTAEDDPYKKSNNGIQYIEGVIPEHILYKTTGEEYIPDEKLTLLNDKDSDYSHWKTSKGKYVLCKPLNPNLKEYIKQITFEDERDISILTIEYISNPSCMLDENYANLHIYGIGFMTTPVE